MRYYISIGGTSPSSTTYKPQIMKATTTATKAALLRRMAQLQAEAEICYDPDRAREIVTEVTVIETILY
jgi:hypothetical protein